MTPEDAAYHSSSDSALPKSLECRHHTKKQRCQRQAGRRLSRRTVDESAFCPEYRWLDRPILCALFDSVPNIGRGRFYLAFLPVAASKPEAWPSHRRPGRYRPWYAARSAPDDYRLG